MALCAPCQTEGEGRALLYLTVTSQSLHDADPTYGWEKRKWETSDVLKSRKEVTARVSLLPSTPE